MNVTKTQDGTKAPVVDLHKMEDFVMAEPVGAVCELGELHSWSSAKVGPSWKGSAIAD